RRVVVTVGRLDEIRKGYDTVIRAMRAILARVPDAIYAIAGPGGRGEELLGMARRLGVERAVRVLGFVPDDDLPALYAASDVFVMPNRDIGDGDTEGFGMVFLEASASGRPVIAGRCGGTADSVIDGETGFRIDPEDDRSLADHVVALLTDRGLARKLGERGRAFSEEGFDWSSRAAHVATVSARLAVPRR